MSLENEPNQQIKITKIQLPQEIKNDYLLASRPVSGPLGDGERQVFHYLKTRNLKKKEK